MDGTDGIRVMDTILTMLIRGTIHIMEIIGDGDITIRTMEELLFTMVPKEHPEIMDQEATD